MNILTLLRMVPDVVEELEVASDGKRLDTEFLRMIVSESDDHALEEALILKERHGGKVTVLALDAPEVDDALYAALAKGADRAMKIIGTETGLSTSVAAQIFARVLSQDSGLMPADLILAGTQAIDDLDGLVAPLMAHHLRLPFVGIVTGVDVDISNSTATVIREFPSSVRGEFEVPLPAVLGIQAAEKPPRYVPVAKVRAVMKSQKIETAPAPAEGILALMEVLQMSKPQLATHAEMLDGSPEQVAGKLCELWAQRGLL
jgi:electron transfer flavoprotein beta subunit